MGWKLNKNGVTPRVELTRSEQQNLNTFMNAVRSNVDPKKAADLWDSNFKNLYRDQYQIRLSQGNRATFEVDWDTQTVTMLQVGGHT